METHLQNQVWSFAICAWITMIVLSGGTSQPDETTFVFQSLVSFALIVLAAWRLRFGLPSRLAFFGMWLAVGMFGVVLAQLVPLPPALWTLLPGRTFVVTTLTLIGRKEAWQPITLSVTDTRIAAVSLLVPLAGFLAALTLPARDWFKAGLVIVGCALLGLLFALLQRANLLGIEGGAGGRFAAGLFANRNFAAAQLYTSIPFLAALAVTARSKWQIRGWLLMGFALIYGAILVVGLAVLASRAGIVLAMVVSFMTALFVYRVPHQDRDRPRSAIGILAVVGTLLVICQASMVGILRLAQTDPVADARSTIFNLTLNAIKTFFPVGSGFGTFVPVYQRFETPETITAAYVNHAHNDWLEIVLGGGLAAAALLVGFVLLSCAAAASIFRQMVSSSAQVYQRAATVCVFALAAHSAVDYPLRTPALSGLGGLLLGLMLANALAVRSRGPALQGQPLSTPRAFVAPKGFGPRRPAP